MSANQPASLGAAAIRPIRESVQLNWGRLTTIATVLVVIGVVGVLGGLAAGQPQRVWLTWLVNLLFFMGIAQGGVIVSAGFYLTQGRWAGSTHYRLAESFWRFLPLALILFLGVCIGADYIFPWIAHPVTNKAKAWWLTAPFLLTRDFVAIAIMALLSRRFVGISQTEEAVAWHHQPDTIEMPPGPIRRWAPLLAICYCVAYTLFAYDLISSLSPQWHSTLFGWWYFATVFWSAICAMSFTAARMRGILPAGNMFTRGKVLHDLGKMIFAFSVFWMYLTYAQYIVIWYGDIPTETFFLVGRCWHHPWMFMTWMAPVLIWVTPFSVLMGVAPKKTPKILGTVALLGMIGVWDLNYVLIVPSLSPDKLPLGWIELCITAGFLGAFLLCAVPGLKQLADVAVSDALETSDEAPRNIKFKRANFMAALIAMAVGLVGCASGGPYRLDTLSPKSDLTREILNLFKEVTILDSLVLVVVIGAMIGAIFIYSSREGDPGEPSAMHSDVTLEMLWTVIPAVILVAITVPTVHTIIRTQPTEWPAATLEVKVIAHQWWWEFQYPTLGVVTADEVHIPVDRTIHFAMTSKDVIHSFFMPSIGGKRDVVPGQENQITLKADTPGEYYGQCTEFCGTSHANMRFRVFVDTPEEFNKWVAHQNEGPVQPTDGAAAAGAKIWADAPCAICHTIKGISGFSKDYTYGFRGPDLTHFGSRTTMAGSILPNTPENVALWITNPDAVKPGANMPTLGLSGEDLSNLVAYLESLK